jgi:hypothetical protein
LNLLAIVFSINNKGTDDSLKAGGGKLTGLWETAVEHLEKSPFAHILKFVDSQLAKNNQAFMDKVIRTAFTVFSVKFISQIYICSIILLASALPRTDS